MTNRLAVTLDDDQQQQLEALAERHETPAAMAARALTEYLAGDAAFRRAVEGRAVEEGLAAVDAGDVVDYRPFAEELRRKMARASRRDDGQAL